MFGILAKDDPGLIVLGIIALVVIGVICVAVVVKEISNLFNPNVPFRDRFRKYFGRDFDSLQTHEKKFPGYDLASVHRAIASFHSDMCSETKEIGGTTYHNLRDLFQQLKTMGNSRLRPHTATYERVPIDVGEEESLASTMLWFAQTREAPNAPTTKIAILLSAVTTSDYDDDFESRRATQRVLMLSIACRDKGIADRYFSEIEHRRRELSIFRGKVVDPDVHQGGIRSIGFSAIKRVGEQDLILADSVKQLLHNAIVGFYNHADTLRAVGVEMKRGILFHSLPGTGKTSISLYLAGLLPKFTVCFVSGQRLLYPREICRMARYLQPAMVVFEDIDLVAEERDTNGLATVLGELMNQIDGCEPDEQVLFIMNTNSLERLEKAVRNRPGRVDQIIDIPLPDADARRRLIMHFARNVKIADERLIGVLDATEGVTPATLKEIVKRATVAAIERGSGNGDTAVELTEGDLVLSAKQVQVMRETKLPGARMGFG